MNNTVNRIAEDEQKIAWYGTAVQVDQKTGLMWFIQGTIIMKGEAMQFRGRIIGSAN